MKTPFADTPSHVHEMLIKGYRNMTPPQKIRQVAELNRTVQQFALARIRKEHGEIPEREQQLRLAALWLGRETMVRVFGWDPQVHGY